MSRHLAGLLLIVCARAGHAADTSGLDLTIEVLGREDSIDERIVNRIEIPGVELQRLRGDQRPIEAIGGAVNGVVQGVGGVVEGLAQSVAPLLPLLRYDEWVEQRREAEQDRRREARERPRQRGE